MEESQYLRVVSVRKGKLKPPEFKLRKGERGLSLFLYLEQGKDAEILEALRAAGKTGDLAAAIISAEDLHDLGLVVVRTPGQTLNREVNTLHREARIPFWRRILLWFRGVPAQEFFNENVAPMICERVRIVD